MKLVGKYVSNHFLAYVCALILGIVTQIVALVQPKLSGVLISRVQQHVSVTSLALLLGAIVVLEAVLSAVQQAIVGSIGESTVFGVRRQLSGKFFRLGNLSLESRPPAWYSQRMTNDTALVKSLTSQTISLVQAMVLAIGSAAAAVSLSWVAFLLVLLPAALSVLLVALASRPIRKWQNCLQESSMNMTTTIQESASAIRTIRAYNATSVMESRLGSSIDESYRYGKKLVYLSSCFGPLSQILMQVANIIAIVYGAYEVASGKMEFSALVMFLMYFSYFSSGVSTIAGAFGRVQQAMVGDHRINEFEQIDEEQQPHGTDATGLDRPPAVDFHGIDHHYPNNTSKSLNRVSFSVPSRKVTALVGQSGGGKTTCLSLIEGFLAPDCGSLLIDGYELESFDLHALRSDMAYVEQTPSILSGTIRSNIQLGDPQASDETILESIHQVGLRIPGTTDDTILDLPVGAAGVSLSGGQCQRVALARAFIRHPKLLLMDEPTSSLDGIAEASIARLIRKHMKDSTIIYSAHRLSLILEADWIVVIKNGKVIDQGTHNDLAQRCDYYRELITAQTPQGTENN